MGEHDDWCPPPDCSMVQDFPSLLASFDYEYEWQLVPLFMNCECKNFPRRKLQTKFSSIWSLDRNNLLSNCFFVFDLCCFFHNLRRLQLLRLWSVLFLQQSQARAVAVSLIKFAISSTISGACGCFLFDFCCFLQQWQGAWSCFLFWYLLFLPQSQALEPASSVIFGVSSTISKRLQLLPVGSLLFLQQHQALEASNFVNFTLESMAVLLAYTPRCQIGSSKHCIGYILDWKIIWTNNWNKVIATRNKTTAHPQRPGEKTRPQHASY